MHKLINNTPDGFDTDHINGNKLDNRKCNLRTASRSLNKHNWARLENKGAHRYGNCGKWRAAITVNYKQIHLGCFNTREEAIVAHHKALEEVIYAGESSRSTGQDVSEGISNHLRLPGQST